jgi:hypothetical protein
MTVTVTPLQPTLGAEISGVDLSRPLDTGVKDALSHALAEHPALVFHDQSLTPEQCLAAAEAFGPPMRQHHSQHDMPDHPDIGLVRHRNGQQPAERWHTNREKPPAATILYRSARQNDPGGDRLRASMAPRRRSGHRRPGDHAPGARRLRPRREPGPVAHHRRGRPARSDVTPVFKGANHGEGHPSRRVRLYQGSG